MFLRHTTDDENNVGTWAHEHEFYFPRRDFCRAVLRAQLPGTA